ncbi:MAG: hypothetical protein AB7Q69_03705 [Gemmatimonadales bacterium]
MEATIIPARLVEDAVLTVRPVGAADGWPGPVAFLDGIQRHQVVAYLGTTPLIIATIAAAVRRRTGRRFRTAEEGWRTLALGRRELLEAMAPELEGCLPVPLEDEEESHPIRDTVALRRLIDLERGRLEVALGCRYREQADGWLVVDGSLSESPELAAAPRTIGVTKSHAALPFAGEPLERYLTLPAGARSSVFAQVTTRYAQVYSWGLRLWPWEGKDLLYGLIRVEARPGDDTLAAADEISRWLLAERAPVSSPDPRWDRLLYGIRDVETYLKARLR